MKLYYLLALGPAVLATGTTTQNNDSLIAVAPTLSPVPFVMEKTTPIIQEEVVYVQPTRAEYVEAGVPQPSTNDDGADGLSGSIGYASPYGNCVNEEGINKAPGNPISWAVLSSSPSIGATALWTYNHTGIVTGIWSNGDLEIRHQNFTGGQHRFPRSAFRGFR